MSGIAADVLCRLLGCIPAPVLPGQPISVGHCSRCRKTAP